MSRFTPLLMSVTAVVLFPLAGLADSITVLNDSTPGGWITYTGGASGLNTNGGGSYGTPYSANSPFWNNGSSDGAGGKNVGNFLTKQNFFSGNPNSPNISVNNLQFWGSQTSPGFADSTEIFSGPNGSAAATFQVGLAGNFSNNALWVAQVNSTGAVITGTAQELFNGSQSSNQSSTFTVSGDFIFYMKNTAAGYDFASDTTSAGSAYNNDGANQHFAVFRDSSNPNGPVYVGVEDLPYASSDLDFNDLAFSVQAVPEPCSFVLMSLGAVACLGGGLRRRRNVEITAA